MTTVRQPTKCRRSCVLILKYTFICVYWWTRQIIHNTLIVVDQYLRLMGDKMIPDSAEPRLESFYPPFVAGIDLPHQGVVDSYNLQIKQDGVTANDKFKVLIFLMVWNRQKAIVFYIMFQFSGIYMHQYDRRVCGKNRFHLYINLHSTLTFPYLTLRLTPPGSPRDHIFINIISSEIVHRAANMWVISFGHISEGMVKLYLDFLPTVSSTWIILATELYQTDIQPGYWCSQTPTVRILTWPMVQPSRHTHSPQNVLKTTFNFRLLGD